MSEWHESQDVATCRKLDSPRSLRGLEDADLIWEMITRRFPNSAPLLCELEAVIDRADQLLQQLKTPDARTIEKGSSVRAADSDESELGQELSVDENIDTRSEGVSANIGEAQISKSTIRETGTDLDSRSRSRHSLSRDQNEEYIREKQSLEDWGKLVGDIMGSHVDVRGSDIKASERSHVARAVRPNEGQREKLDGSGEELISGDGERNNEGSEISVVAARQTNDEPFATDRNGVTDVSSRLVTNASADRAAKRTVSTIGDASSPPATNTERRVTSTDRDNAKAGSGDETDEKRATGRDPVAILEEYARRCETSVAYHCEISKTKRYIITCQLAAFSECGLGESEAQARTNSAAKILCLIAAHQMDDKKLAPLSRLTGDEMLEIMGLAARRIEETAQRRLYRLCLEKGARVPEYEIQKRPTPPCVLARCTALGHVGLGHGAREQVAKRIAADRVYEMYRQSAKR